MRPRVSCCASPEERSQRHDPGDQDHLAPFHPGRQAPDRPARWAEFGQERTVTLAVFEVATGRKLASFENVGSNRWFGSLLPPPEIRALRRRFDPGVLPDAGHQKGQVIVWDINAGKAIAEFPGTPPLALAPDGSMIAHGDGRPDATFPAIGALKKGRPTPSSQHRA